MTPNASWDQCKALAEKHTDGPWYVGCQNDALFVTAGRKPAPSNDHPWHDAPRVAICKVFGPSEGDCLPIDATANAYLLAAAPELLEALEAVELARATDASADWLRATKLTDAAIAKARGQS